MEEFCRTVKPSLEGYEADGVGRLIALPDGNNTDILKRPGQLS